VNLNPFFWHNDIIVEVLEDFRVLGMHRDQHSRLHSLNHVAYLVSKALIVDETN